MIKFVPSMTNVVMEEIPDKVTLAVEISNCQGLCEGCHSPWLRDNIGQELDEPVVDALIADNFGIDCFLILGEGKDRDALLAVAAYLRRKYASKGIEVGLYSGRQDVEQDIWDAFDYVKVGPYIPEFGPLNKPTTNQRLYKVHRDGSREDLTPIFWRVKRTEEL